MLIPAKPIPAFYCVYVLRSTIRHASLYIGSTPHPPRRLKQHNGEVKGGARKTSRRDYRPWEMITLVSGFPSAVAALKFEWALNNAHLTLHIPAEARLAVPTKRKRGGRPGRPRRTLSSIVANIHLLVGVASFARWPLNVHFFAREALLEWEDRMRCSETPARPGLRVLTDFSSAAAGARGGEGEEEEEEEEEEDAAPAGGIHDLTLDYGDIGGYVEKANEAVAFERAGRCVHCGGELANGQGLYPMCSHEGCEATGHLDCWSRHALRSVGDGDGDGDEVLLPNECECPSCGSTNRWGDMMKELSLRVRGGDVVEKLVKRRQRARKKAKAAAAA